VAEGFGFGVTAAGLLHTSFLPDFMQVNFFDL
jgi:hypothetical protein